jgi:transmembrane protein 18
MAEASSSSYFSRLASDILAGAEELSNRLDQGLSSFMFPGTQQQQQQADEEEVPDGMDGMENNDDNNEDWSMRRSPLEDLTEGVLGDIMRGQQQPMTLLQQVQAFRHAISWTEPFIVALLAFHVVMFLMSMYVARKNATLTARLGLMITIGVIVRLAERLNALGAQYWNSFATQNYFDGHGVFCSVMLCAPLMLDCIVMLLCFLREASQLLVQVKSTQIKRQRQMQKVEAKSSDDKTNAALSKVETKKNTKAGAKKDQ